ncbi:MAG: methionyl-tRNA formyltransferase [bacterium]|nr:methionyl-tRNA formyltransferase [bacterium]
MKIAYFGTSKFSIHVLDELFTSGIVPEVIITAPDKPQGRKMILTPTPVKEWAINHKIPVLTPPKLNDEFIADIQKFNFDLFIVASYGKIIPDRILELPKFKSINVHPSLLPLYRGPSPIQSMILNDEKNIGVTIIKMDKEMDHGPILAQENFTPAKWPVTLDELKSDLGKIGGKMLIDLIPNIESGKIKEKIQEHDKAVFTKKITKEDGFINLADDPYKNYLKYCAYKGWPSVYFFIEKGDKKIRVIINEADFKNGEFLILKVTIEGRSQMTKEEFDHWNLKN